MGPGKKTRRPFFFTTRLICFQIGRKDTCVTVTMHRIGLVAAGQPVPIHVFDYYEPSKFFLLFFTLENKFSSRQTDLSKVMIRVYMVFHTVKLDQTAIEKTSIWKGLKRHKMGSVYVLVYLNVKWTFPFLSFG